MHVARWSSLLRDIKCNTLQHTLQRTAARTATHYLEGRAVVVISARHQNPDGVNEESHLPWHSVLQCVAVCGAVCCSVLQCVSVL